MITVRNNKVLNTTCGRVLVKLSEPNKVTKSGIIIPNTSQKQTDFIGTVVLVSKSDDLNKKGDRVVVKKHSGIKVEVDQEGTYRMYDKTDLLWNLTQNPVDGRSI